MIGEAQQRSQQSDLRRRQGRPKGAGGYSICDQPLIAEMRAGIEAGRYQSAWGSAAHVSVRAAGGGTPFAKTLRLYNRYTETFGKKKA